MWTVRNASLGPVHDNLTCSNGPARTRGWTTDGPLAWTTKRTTLDQGWTTLVIEAILSVHMSFMSNVRKAVTTMAAAAVFLTVATGCSDGINPVGVVVTDQEREAYEAARFGTPEGNAVADRELARMTSGNLYSVPVTPDVNSVLLRPGDWPELAKGKLCEYTATLIGNADRDGTAVPEKARTAANRILERC